MDFRILGPLEIVEQGSAIRLGGGRQRALLAMLLLHANEVVSSDRLVDELWGAEPPSSAVKIVQVYVSQLRKLLGAETIVTRPPGYVVQIAPGELDLHRFEHLLQEARHAGPAAAASKLREALAIWRGAALADFAYDAFAQEERARLEELRLDALEARIDADLALGEGAELVGELQALVARYPLRELLRGQLMLALYRAGRQAEALDVYQEGARALDEELGLEPSVRLKGLQKAILVHDPSLEPVRKPARPATLDPGLSGERVRKPLLPAALLGHGRTLMLVGGLILAGAIAAAVLGLTSKGSEGLASVAPNSVGAIDPKTNRIVAQISPGGGPARLASNGRSLWAGSDDSATISAVDPRTKTVTKSFPTGGFPSDLAVGQRAVWVVDGRRGLLLKVDPVYGPAAEPIRVARPNPGYDTSREGLDPIAVAAGAGSVWLTDGSSKLVRVDPKTGKFVRINLHVRLDDVAVGAGAVWAISGAAAEAIRLDPHSRVVTRIPISRPGFDFPYPRAVAVGAGSVWVLNGNTETVTRIDPVQRAVSTTIPIGIEHAPLRLAVGAGAAWVADSDGTLARIDAGTNDLTFIALGHGLKDVAVANKGVWVTAGAGSSSTASAAPTLERGRVQPLPTSSCAPIYYGGGGQPRYLIASDLPLQGADGASIAQLGLAIQFVLREHRFRAGRYAVGFQSCDDSTVQVGARSEARCAANARAYAADESVVGVIGAFNSACSVKEIPILNRARKGPLAMISFSNTLVGLTHHGLRSESNEPAKYYPTGKRNYARIIAADDYQGAANAVLAQQLGLRHVYVLDDGEAYGRGVAASFTSAASKLGIMIVGSKTWRWAGTYGRLATQVRHTDADGVFLAGIVDANGPQLVKDLRAGLDGRTRLLAPDGWQPLSALKRRIGSAAEGMMVSIPGLPNERLPARGRAFIAAFSKEVGESPNEVVASAAQAAEVLLAAIERSDGSRASVRAELFKTKVKGGIVGSFSIDQNGDTTVNAVTIYRIADGAPKLVTVIRPPRSLVR